MLRRLLKDWTLPVAMGFGALVYLTFAFVPLLDEAGERCEPVFDAILPLFMFLILFVTFCKVDYRRLRPVAWHLWTAVAQVVLSSAIVLTVLAMPAGGEALVVGEAILTCVVAPTAAAAAVVTQKLGGQLEEMTTYTFISNATSALLIPLFFPLLEPGNGVSFTAAFLKILHEVVIVLLVPMALAYVVKHFLHRLHRLIVSVRDLSYYLWAVSLTIVTGITMRNIVHAATPLWLLLAIALLGSMTCVVQFAAGRCLGRFAGRTVEAGQALGQKNTAFAIWVATAYLNPVATVGPGCYILWQNIVNSIEIWQKRKSDQRQ